MKLINLTLLTFCLLISCKSNNTNINEPSDSISNVSNKEQNKIDKDSVKIVGDNILKGERIWGKNENYIFPLMDSLTVSNPDSRLFYFKVFGSICEQADGYVSETLGIYVLKYFEFDPTEFIINSKFISDSTFNNMGYHAGLEIFLSNDDDPEKDLENLITSTLEKTKNLTDSNKVKLDIFFSKMKESLESNKE